MANKIRKYSFAFGLELFNSNIPILLPKKDLQILKKMKLLNLKNLIEKKEV
ncbi:MAG: hypothetical protein N2323_02145 [candidate division WOR-3 bacterium]|nr:hypothetical protein [candidate division WOR-3 bacterium]MCX7836748.1 hypothetical protein [candidate division WOR-3 bacterium]MDW8114380.1 hypothetical protein [candidate division WOR-3 bacterium]